MKLALAEARAAFDEGEVPVGCVVVKDGRIIGRGHNRVEALQDPTAHAEIIALTAACQHAKNWRLEGAVVYVTQEPCIMCAGACVLARVREVVFGIPDPKFGALVSLYRVSQDARLNHRFACRQGPCGDEARELMHRFFRDRRKKSGR